MVKVIKQGKKNFVDCFDCGAVLQYDSHDVWKKYEPPRGLDEMEGFDSYFIRCPCGSKINLGTYEFCKDLERIIKRKDNGRL